ncbi:MAG: VTT domain-containing protein [Alphaproteobacteria bacterium]|nr:VTT domain-containing protein [Alphaproteobacteria bacterium]
MIDRTTVLKLVGGALAVLAVAGLCGVLLREPLIAWGGLFLDRFGLAGLFFGAMFTDSSIVPLTNEPLMLLAISGGANPWVVAAITAAGSVLAGPIGWTCGRLLARHTRLGPWLARRHPQVVAFLTRYGARFVAVAALLPFPFAVSTWLSGATDVRFGHLLLASLLRIPKTLFYAALLTGGWAAGG